MTYLIMHKMHCANFQNTVKSAHMTFFCNAATLEKLNSTKQTMYV